MLKYALRFGGHAQFKKILGADADFTAGLAIGATEAFLIVTPFEVVKTRMQMQKHYASTTVATPYRNPFQCVKHIIKTEGIRAIWSGGLPTVLRNSTNQAFNFAAFAMLNKHVWQKAQGDGKKLETWKTLTNGFLAGLLGPCMSAPLDVIKTRLMAQERKTSAPTSQSPTSQSQLRYRGMTHAFRVIVREEGFAALYKGLLPRLMRIAPGQAITWTVVMQVQSFFGHH
jgi:solute carrier family 25 citrate transporter 1